MSTTKKRKNSGLPSSSLKLQRTGKLQRKKEMEIRQENKENEMPIKRIKVKVIGIGGGGSSIVSDISTTLKGAKFLAANTDKASFAKLKRTIGTFQFGEELTKGFGTGMNMELGYQAALSDKERITNTLQGYDLCILVSCLGGGTGSGAASVFAEISKGLGNLTYGIFTLPFDFEGKKKLEIAKEALKKLEPLLNALTIVPNERIFKVVDRKLPLKQALFLINKTLSFNLAGLLGMIYQPGIINIDFADIKTILTGKESLAYLNRVEAKGEERAKKLIQDVLNNLLYPYDISAAKRILFNIAGPADLSLLEVSQISQGISNAADKEAKIIFGVSQKKEKEKLEVCLLAIGCQMKNLFPQFKKIKKIKEKIESLKKEEVKEEKKPDEVISADKENQKEVILTSEESQKDVKPLKELEEKKLKKRKKTKNLPTLKLRRARKKIKIRKNALQVKKDIEDLEEELQKQEEIWESPAFLRKKT